MGIHRDIMKLYNFLIVYNLNPSWCFIPLVFFIFNNLSDSFSDKTKSHLLCLLILTFWVFPFFISYRGCPHPSNYLAIYYVLTQAVPKLLLYVFEQTKPVIFFLSLWFGRWFFHHYWSLLNLWSFLFLCRSLNRLNLRDFNDVDFRWCL
jgi:hypothetical protein